MEWLAAIAAVHITGVCICIGFALIESDWHLMYMSIQSARTNRCKAWPDR
jgi:hypothetical protein